MLLSSGTVISKCCGAVVYEHDDGKWHCMKCFQPCEGGGTIGDLCEAKNKRRELESTLATTFIAQQKERDPAERTRLWNRCLELVAELERLNATDTEKITDTNPQ